MSTALCNVLKRCETSSRGKKITSEGIKSINGITGIHYADVNAKGGLFFMKVGLANIAEYSFAILHSVYFEF